MTDWDITHLLSNYSIFKENTNAGLRKGKKRTKKVTHEIIIISFYIILLLSFSTHVCLTGSFANKKDDYLLVLPAQNDMHFDGINNA